MTLKQKINQLVSECTDIADKYERDALKMEKSEHAAKYNGKAAGIREVLRKINNIS